MNKFTEILCGVQRGEPLATEALLPLVYDELRNLASARLAQESHGQTLQPTALVHEVYLKLTAHEPVPDWQNRRHFFAAAAEAMRRILIDRARSKLSERHGGRFQRQELHDDFIADDCRSANLIALSEALDELAEHDQQAAQLVELRYFAGLNHQDAAAALQISRRSADRLWALARAWLYRRLNEA
ncbi:MAG: ECF-type sigma factor [Pirellulales bacterium]